MDEKVYDEASEAEPVDGNVALMGPNGVSVMITPEAAAETSDRLLDAAVHAKGETVRAGLAKKERRALGLERDL